MHGREDTEFRWERCEGKRPVRRYRRRMENNIKMNLIEIGWGCGLDSSGSGCGPVVRLL
jgi:hypothetical protein